MPTIGERARALQEMLQELVNDAVASGNTFSLEFKAPGPRHNNGLQRVGFRLEEDYTYEEEEDETGEWVETEKVVMTSRPTGAWYSSSWNC